MLPLLLTHRFGAFFIVVAVLLPLTAAAQQSPQTWRRSPLLHTSTVLPSAPHGRNCAVCKNSICKRWPTISPM